MLASKSSALLTFHNNEDFFLHIGKMRRDETLDLEFFKASSFSQTYILYVYSDIVFKINNVYMLEEEKVFFIIESNEKHFHENSKLCREIV
jgi:hypothetical protein